MFDFSFPELLVCFVVALVVLGPTRLPGLVRKVGRWVGKARSMAREFRDQLEQEVNVEELNRSVRRTVMDEPPPPPPAAATSSTPAEAGEELAQGGYPYGSSSSSSADPAVTDAGGPQPGDDDYSHAHAPGAAPEPWNADPAPSAVENADAALADATGTQHDARREHNT